VVFGFGEVPAQQPIDEIEELGQLRRFHAPDHGGHDRIVRKLLQITDDGVLVGLPVQPEPDKSSLVFDKPVGVSIHEGLVVKPIAIGKGSLDSCHTNRVRCTRLQVQR
jgi:hypothetical protein